MKEAKKLVLHSPVREAGEYSPVRTPEVIGGTLQTLVKGFKEETKMLGSTKSKSKYTKKINIF